MVTVGNYLQLINKLDATARVSTFVTGIRRSSDKYRCRSRSHSKDVKRGLISVLLGPTR
jgi:hypothetical protein